MKLQMTSDNSYTLFSSGVQQTYHSTEGAIMESRHVYVDSAFTHFQDKKELRILEIGFGTGLNALVTQLTAQQRKTTVFYETIEAYPVPEDIVYCLNYPELLCCDRDLFLSFHHAQSDVITTFPYFIFSKRHISLEKYTPDLSFYDVIYFDAFSPDAQPELWEEPVFEKMFSALAPNGVLLTYSAKGIVKKALRAAGFQVKRLPGAGSKHHMIKAIKFV